MILEMKVPSPGESIKEVEIATWLVQDGDYVEKDEEIAEIDSDKATLTLVADLFLSASLPSLSITLSANLSIVSPNSSPAAIVLLIISSVVSTKLFENLVVCFKSSFLTKGLNMSKEI